MQINILEAKNQLSALLRRAEAGEDIVIAHRGRPVARLVPVRGAQAGGGDDDQGLVGWLAANPMPPQARRPAADIDAGIAQERAAWD